MRWLLGVVVLPILLVVGLFYLVTDSQPSLRRASVISVADLDRGKAIVDSLGLRRMREGETRQLVLSENDLDLGVGYLAARLAKGSATARIALDQLIVRASLPLPGIGRYVNLELALAQGGDTLEPSELRLGALPIPAVLAAPLVGGALALSPYSEGLSAARELLDSAQLTGGSLALKFTWRGASVDRVVANGAGLGTDNAAVEAYRARLRQVRERDFAVLMGSVFELAKQRSLGHDPVAENRAALAALAETALGSRLVSRRGVVDPNRHTGIRLAGREDFSQHFSLSAFIAATGGEGLSDLAGLYKELKDSRGGSGFSFNDIAADRAGSRFGETLTRSPAHARKMQERLAGARDAAAFFPRVADLPEFMDQAEFQRRFGGVGAPAYRAMVDEIERRIAGLSLYRD